MRSAMLVGFTLFCSITLVGQGSGAHPAVRTAESGGGTLRSELEAVHAKWFKAFDDGDGATLNQLETDNLMLVMPDGQVWPKTKPRVSGPKTDPYPERTLNEVSVREFGDTAVLVGILTTKSSAESSKSTTTVVFVRRAGRWLVASAQWGPATGAK